MKDEDDYFDLNTQHRANDSELYFSIGEVLEKQVQRNIDRM